MALSSVPSVSKYSSSQHPSVRAGDMKEKPLIEQTRRAILEAQSTRFNNFSATKESHDLKRTGNALYCSSQVALSGVPLEECAENTASVESKNIEGGPFTGDETPRKVLSEWEVDIKKRQERELRFTASGWKRDCHGNGTKMKMLNSTRMKMILTSASARRTGRHSGCFRNIQLSFKFQMKVNQTQDWHTSWRQPA